jgi:acyl dehydratase
VLLARQLYFEAVKVGDELPPLVKPPVDRSQIARFAGATGDYGPLHVDEPFARNAGFPSVLVPGMLAMGFLGELVTDWLRGARVRRFGSRFVKIVWPGDVVTVRGRVADRRFESGGRYAVDIEVWGENQRGELVVRGAVTAQLYYSSEDETRQRNGQPPLVVTPAEEEERLAKLSRSTAPARPAVGTRPAVAPGKAQPAPGPKAAPAAARVPPPPAKAPAPRPAAPPKPAVAAKPPAPRKAQATRPPARKPEPRKSAPKKAAPKKAAPKGAPARRPAPKKAPRPAPKKKADKRR